MRLTGLLFIPLLLAIAAVAWAADVPRGENGDACRGDIDANGFVNFDDFQAIIDNFGPLSGKCEACDLNDDGVIDGDDLSIAVFELGGHCPYEGNECPNDFNANGDIDILDYFILLGWYGQDCTDGVGDDEECEEYDVNGGGYVGLSDLVIHFFRILGPGC